MPLVRPSTKAPRDRNGRSMYYTSFVEMHRAVNLKKLGVNKKARAMGKITTTQVVSVNKSRTQVRQILLEAHLESPTTALEQAFPRTEDGA